MSEGGVLIKWWCRQTPNYVTFIQDSNQISNILRFYRQNKGISQGSCISSLLCHVYLSHMEENCLRTHPEDSIFRVVDDYLFITTSRSRAVSFVRFFLTPDQTYNVITNHQKTLVNFHYDHQISRVDRFMPWCGFLIDTQTLEIHSDFSKYKTFHFRHSISTFSFRSPGLQILHKLQLALKSKTSAIFFDERINTTRTIFYNLYKLFLISAFRFYRLVRSLATPNSANENPRFFMDTIYRLSFFVASRYRSQSCLRHSYPTIVEHLCLRAFETKLSSHKPLFKAILDHIHSRLTATRPVYHRHMDHFHLDFFPLDFQLICD